MLHALFTDHPASVDETYTEHMGVATCFAARLFLGSAACLVHAFLPFLFVKTASSIIAELNQRMVINRRHGPGRLANQATPASR